MEPYNPIDTSSTTPISLNVVEQFLQQGDHHMREGELGKAYVAYCRGYTFAKTPVDTQKVCSAISDLNPHNAIDFMPAGGLRVLLDEPENPLYQFIGEMTPFTTSSAMMDVVFALHHPQRKIWVYRDQDYPHVQVSMRELITYENLQEALGPIGSKLLSFQQPTYDPSIGIGVVDLGEEKVRISAFNPINQYAIYVGIQNFERDNLEDITRYFRFERKKEINGEIIPTIAGVPIYKGKDLANINLFDFFFVTDLRAEDQKRSDEELVQLSKNPELLDQVKRYDSVLTKLAKRLGFAKIIQYLSQQRGK